jgi:hypothetical protein
VAELPVFYFHVKISSYNAYNSVNTSYLTIDE